MTDRRLPPIPLSALLSLYRDSVDARGGGEVIALPVPVPLPRPAPQGRLPALPGGGIVIAFPAPKWQRNAARSRI